MEISRLEEHQEPWEFLLCSLGNGKLVKVSPSETDMWFVKMVFPARLGSVA